MELPRIQSGEAGVIQVWKVTMFNVYMQTVLGKRFIVSQVQQQQQERCECPFSLEDGD